MKLLTAPTTSMLYPELASESVIAVRMKLGMSRISLNYRRLPGNIEPMLVIDFFNNKGKLYTLCYNFPPDTPGRTERRTSLLIHLIQKIWVNSVTWLRNQLFNYLFGYENHDKIV
ncbi:hypothetical protein SGGMMB4_05887 (plasmid) [Sodalis glossinidius str. 'morsitans']|nr:hypothetical protein [Sodalis glossinidius]CAI59366.1 hypothetical protein pSG2.06 [Sodalis glossinidius]CAI59580.1 hypothetical protein pSG2.06 [Sodalis glossinidius]CRL46917.1 hypothetical protein SGGMMB4_05887 [Sodalis glossinidius str. 'morsitans']